MFLSKRNKGGLSLVILIYCLLNHKLCAQTISIQHTNTSITNEILAGVGVVLDMESWVGKSIQWCISMAISDFYVLNHSYKTRIVLHPRDSKGDPLEALSAVQYLVKNMKVQSIIGPDMFLQSKLLSLIAEKAKVPLFSLAGSSSIEYPYLFHIKEDESAMANSIADLVESYKWRNVIFVYEETDDGRQILPYLTDSLHDKNIRINYKSAISPLVTHDEVSKELSKLLTLDTSIIIVHMSPSLASTFFLNAKRLGMVTDNYAWILTGKTVDVLRSPDFRVIDSLQGVLGFRPYVPTSNRLHNLTGRWQNFIYKNYPISLTRELPVPAIWAYDTIWALAESVEKLDQVLHRSPNLILNEVSKMRFKGISGEFGFRSGELISNGYEIMNAVDHSEKRVGYWTQSGGIRRAHLPIKIVDSYSNLGSEAVVWPGGTTTAPKGRVLLTTPSGQRLKIGVLKIRTFQHFMDVDHDIETNVTTAKGFSFDVFSTCIQALPYEVPYVFIPFENCSYDNHVCSYDDLVQKVYNEEIDAVVGDSTIVANRSELVDFTATYTDLGIGTLSRIKKKDMWFFLKPLDAGLWLTAIASLILTGGVVWAIECMNRDSESLPCQRIGTIFWLILLTLFFAQRENLSSNLSKFVMFIWLLVVLVLITGYTATLSSLLTVEQFELASKRGIVGVHGGSFMKGVTVNNLHLEDQSKRLYYSYEDYARALSQDGDADAIIDEIPYIKMFLARMSGDYAIVSSQPITSGFAFIFKKGSPMVEDMSREIAKIRLDGTLGRLENKWFEHPLSIPSQNSTIPKVLKLDKFGGLFITNAVSSVVALTISAIYLLCAKMEVQNIISLVLRRDLMVAVRYLMNKNVIRV